MQTVVRDTISVPANGEVSNALEGTDLEFSPKNGAIQPFVSGASDGVKADLRTPRQQIANDASVGASDNNPPLVPDDIFSGPFRVRQGERTILRLRNTTGSAIDVYIYFQQP